ncbi:MAG TPA: DUF2917 domain-containing protein [Burkholderiales bacterium]|nr:DUF2917 domain-containing protein [Burkholderiales bacterium]
MDLSQLAGGIDLAHGQALRLQDAVGRRITVLQGHVWITQDRDPRDVVLGAGDDFVIERPGLALVTPLDGPARIAQS